ncbi:MAG: hypothetical protein MUE36_04890 [Acidimicrobiales bacterium]|jgi:hypothetical protein|nr:hypothetical protein [Acidimicrobiales bacterium]
MTDPDDVAPPDDANLDRWLAEVRVDDAARSRAEVAEQRSRAAEEATLPGVLTDLAGRGEPVGLMMRSGVQHRGWVRLVGPDAAVLRLETRQWLAVRLAAISALRTVSSSPVPGEADPSTSSRFERLVLAAAQPGDWVVVTSGSTTFGGSLVSASAGVAVVRLDNSDIAYVNLGATDEVTTRPSP